MSRPRPRPPVERDEAAGIARIPLTRGHWVVVDLVDADLSEKNWCYRAHCKTAYAVRTARRPDGSQFTEQLHRLIAERVGFGDAEQVDHRDGNGLNCRRDNLRPATQQQNQFNKGKRRDNTSGYKGVSWDSAAGRWRASIQVNKRNVYLGLFDDPAKAHEAYVRAAREYAGEFGRAA